MEHNSDESSSEAQSSDSAAEARNDRYVHTHSKPTTFSLLNSLLPNLIVFSALEIYKKRLQNEEKLDFLPDEFMKSLDEG